MVLKKRLGRELVTQLYSPKEAAAAEAHFEKVFQKREVPEQVAEVPSGELMDMLVAQGLAKSRNDARRLVAQGAVDVDGQKATDAHMVVPKNSIIKVGKRGYIKAT